jgi:hypothetical protein
MNKHKIFIADSRFILPVIKKKIGSEQVDIFGQTVVEAIRPARAPIDCQQEIQKLPYIFYDPERTGNKTGGWCAPLSIRM